MFKVPNMYSTQPKLPFCHFFIIISFFNFNIYRNGWLEITLLKYIMTCAYVVYDNYIVGMQP